MVIAQNIPALNTNRMLGINNAKLQKNTEKLSSGYKINRAGDDAAGLAISEKMRAQLRGLAMAGRNSQGGISLIQTAEGALQEVHSILQRMNELAVQSATGTNQTLDRVALQAEYQQLMAEIDHTSKTSTFNDMMLLDGSLAAANFSGTSPGRITSGVGGLKGTSNPIGNVSNWSNISGKDYSVFAGQVKDSIIPNIINKIVSTLPAFDYFKDFNIQIGLDNTLTGSSYAYFSFQWRNTPPEISFSLNLNMNTVATLWKDGDFIDNDARSEFEAMMSHEMMHCMMALTSTMGMTNQPDGYPLWFKEGMAQSMSGGMNWVDSLTGSSTNAQIKTYIENNSLYKTNTNGSASGGQYGTGYLAAMYIAQQASGESTVNGANIASGMNKVMAELSNGISLNEVISKYTKSSGLRNFESSLVNDTDFYDFIRALRAETGTGLGSILSKDLGASDLVGNGNSSSTLFEVNTGNSNINNKLPAGTSPSNGGGSMNTGSPIDENYVPGVPVSPPNNNPTPSINVDGEGLKLQVGAKEGDLLVVSIQQMDSDHIGEMMAGGVVGRKLSESDILTMDSAGTAIKIVRGAINMVSKQRAYLGAKHNRLEHKISNLANANENLAAAESRIRDVDMAEEMTLFTKNNIMVQSATAILAQANARPNNVLSLIK